MSAAPAIPLPEPPPAEFDLAELLAHARDLGDVDVGLSQHWRFRDESAAAGSEHAVSMLPSPQRSAASGRRAKSKSEKVPPRKHSELVEVDARCEDCGWTADSRNAVGIGFQHARCHDHQVVVRQTMETTYERPGAPETKPLFDGG